MINIDDTINICWILYFLLMLIVLNAWLYALVDSIRERFNIRNG